MNDVLFGSPILPQIIDVHTRSWSVFAQGTYHLTDALDFTLGSPLVGDYKIINAFAEYSPPNGNWTVKLSGRNLGNEEYDVIGLALIQGIRVAGEPRMWLAELNYKF